MAKRRPAKMLATEIRHDIARGVHAAWRSLARDVDISAITPMGLLCTQTRVSDIEPVARSVDGRARKLSPKTGLYISK